jgi:hypothetical protein
MHGAAELWGVRCTPESTQREPMVKAAARYAFVLLLATAAGVYLHELGHALAGWVQGIAVIPMPAREYVLRPQIYWSQETWIALGGVAGTAFAAMAAILHFLRTRTLLAEAVLCGVLVPLWVYTVRFVLVGRGHDAIEWQAAQAALGLAPPGHAVDILFLGLLMTGIIVWAVGLRRPLRNHLLRLVGVVIGGTILLLALQVTNNRLFDRFFPTTEVVGAPPGLDPR